MSRIARGFMSHVLKTIFLALSFWGRGSGGNKGEGGECKGGSGEPGEGGAGMYIGKGKGIGWGVGKRWLGDSLSRDRGWGERGNSIE